MQPTPSTLRIACLLALTIGTAALPSSHAAPVPVAQYDLNGNTLDAVGTRHGSLVGSPSYVPGLSGQALDFTGTGHYMTLPGTFGDYAGVNAFSIALWFKLGVSGGDWDYLFYSSDDRPGMRINESDQLLFLFKGSIGDAPLPGDQPGALHPTPIPLDTWTHATMTWDGANFLGYINGSEVANLSLPFLTYGGGIRFGADTTSTRHLQGAIDSIRLYDYALSDVEVQAVYGEVPEPGTWLAGALFLAAAGAGLRRRQSAH